MYVHSPDRRISTTDYVVEFDHTLDKLDLRDEHTEAIVTFNDGTRWYANLVTISRLMAILDKERLHRDHLGGRYVWLPNLIVVNALTAERVVEIIDDMLSTGEFRTAFGPVID